MAYLGKTDVLRYITAARLGPAITDDLIAQACEDVSAEADGYMRAQQVLPLTVPYPRDLVRHLAAIVIWNLLTNQGINPEVGSNPIYERNWNRANEWLTQVARGQVSFALTADSSPEPRPGGARVSSEPRRGW